MMLEIPATRDRISHSPFHCSPPLSLPFPQWPTHCHALEIPSKALDWTVLQCPVQISACESLPRQSLHKVVPSLHFLRLLHLKSVRDCHSLLRSFVSYWVFCVSGWTKALSGQGMHLLFFYHDSLTSYSVVNTLDLVLDDGEVSLKVLLSWKTKAKTS